MAWDSEEGDSLESAGAGVGTGCCTAACTLGAVEGLSG